MHDYMISVPEMTLIVQELARPEHRLNNVFTVQSQISPKQNVAVADGDRRNPSQCSGRLFSSYFVGIN